MCASSLPSDTNRVDGSHLESNAYRLYYDLAASILHGAVGFAFLKVVKNLARGSRHRFHTLWSAPYLTCGPSGPPRPSEAAQDSPGSTFIFPSGFQGLSASRTHSELLPVVTGRGTPRGLRGPPHSRRASVLRGSSRLLRCVRSLTAAPGVESGAIPPSSPSLRRPRRLVRPPVSSPARFHRPSPSSTTASPLSAALRRRAWLRPLPGLHDFTVFTTTYGLHDFPSPLFIPIVATLQRLEGVAVDVLTSRTWFCRSSLRAV
jgi:hypothetical protein